MTLYRSIGKAVPPAISWLESRRLTKEMGPASTAPEAYRPDYFIESVNDLRDPRFAGKHFALDVDLCIGKYHCKDVPSVHQEIIREIAPRSVIVSNSGFKRFKELHRIFGEYGIPCMKLVNVVGHTSQPLLLEAKPQSGITVYTAHEWLGVFDITDGFKEDAEAAGFPGVLDYVSARLRRDLRKPHPAYLRSVASALRKYPKNNPRMQENGTLVMVGDQRDKDVRAAKLANLNNLQPGTIEAALVKPFEPQSNPWYLRIGMPLNERFAEQRSRQG